jgi:hypothetical protein
MKFKNSIPFDEKSLVIWTFEIVIYLGFVFCILKLLKSELWELKKIT